MRIKVKNNKIKMLTCLKLYSRMYLDKSIHNNDNSLKCEFY